MTFMRQPPKGFVNRPHGKAKETKPVVVLDPTQDGVTHLNVYSKGKTELGRFLSNFSRTPFEHPTHGKFDSMEGFWHWLATGCKHDVLRNLYGLHAKNTAKKFERVELLTFHDEIKAAIECKINAYPLFKLMLIKNALPLCHYFVFEGGHVVNQPKFMWQVRHIEELAKKWRSE